MSRPAQPGGARRAGPAAAPALIGAAELALQLASDRRPVLLDVRWSLTGPDRRAFERGHLPEAVFVDLDRELAGPPGAGGRHPLPDPAVLGRMLRRAGIGDGAPVVVYDEHDASAAARAWWLLRWAGLVEVAVLDGGFAAWTGRGLPVATGQEPEPGGGTATVRPGGMPTLDADGVSALVRSAGVLLDARAPGRYRGEFEPVDPIAGHIPGAVNLPYGSVQRPDGRFLPMSEIAAVLDAAGARPGVAVAASCGSGVNACVLVLAGQLVGREIALFPGSYSGWCALRRPVEAG